MKLKTALFHIFTSVLLLHLRPSIAQEMDADKLLSGVREKFGAIHDYEANVTIKVDVDFVKIPLKKGQIWFLHPDKIKVKTPGFALLPKRGMNFSSMQLLSGDYTAIYARDEIVDKVNTSVVKVIPKSDDDEIILSTLWIDPARNVIRKLETTTKKEGTVVMFFSFGDAVKPYDLPEKVTFTFDLRKNELPIGLTGDFETTEPKVKSSGSSRGTVTITYLNYIVNEGKAKEAFKKSDK